MIRPLALVWMGIVIGVSFLATPVKFTADSLTRPVALDVGRATFHALAYLEWVLAALLAVLIWRTATHQQSIGRRALTAAAVVVVAVVVQSAWLNPNSTNASPRSSPVSNHRPHISTRSTASSRSPRWPRSVFSPPGRTRSPGGGPFCDLPRS